jgi:type II secretory pathway pseudopilin PulG
MRPPSAAVARVRIFVSGILLIGLLLTIVVSHTLLAQNQVRLDHLRHQIAVAEQHYDAQRLANGRLSSPARLTERAGQLGLAVPTSPPVAVPVVGAVPQAGSAATNLSAWAEVKGHLDSTP